MKHLELHIIQSVPVACLNRDDLNSPKTAIFGGVQRARVSSQSWKRAIRELASEEYDPEGHFKGKRSRLFIQHISKSLLAMGENENDANALSQCAGHYLAKLDPKQVGKVKTLVFLSQLEIDQIAGILHSSKDDDKRKLVEAMSSVDTAKLASDEDGDEESEEESPMPKAAGAKSLTPKQFGKIVSKVLSQPFKKAFKDEALAKDAADIALFGRMVANDPTLKVEAAAMFSHALSTHKADNEIDFFAAVDDLQPKEDSGAGMTGTLEFNSATYYRFAAVNLDMLADEHHLGTLTADERRSVVRTFVEATIKAVPGARKTTMNCNTFPTYVLGVYRTKGHPIQLVNAFESPIRSSCGYGTDSVRLLEEEYEKLNSTWGIKAIFKAAIPGVSLNEFLDGKTAENGQLVEKGLLSYVD